MTRRLLAQVISRLFGPFSVLPVVVYWLLLFHTGLNYAQKYSIAVILLVVNFAIPLMIFFFLRKSGRISDIDITDRTERNQLLNWVVVCNFVGGVLVWQTNPSAIFKNLYLFGALVLALAVLITNKFKISLHMVGLTVVLLFAMSVIPELVKPWVWFIIIPVAWARIYLKKHTLVEIVAGIALPWIIFLTAYKIMLQ
jgi:membrane-associated phospholipid phosphatase